jgi:hypothetical protein
MFVTSSRSSVTSALRLTFSFFIFVFISAISVSNLSIVLPTSIILPFSFPTRSFSRHCTSLQNSKSASVLTRCVLICNSRPLLPQVLTLKTPSAYSVLHCPRRIPPNPAGGGFAGSSGCVSASSVFAQQNAHARRSKKKTILVFPRIIAVQFKAVQRSVLRPCEWINVSCCQISTTHSTSSPSTPRKRRRKKKIIKGDDEEGRSRSRSDGVAFGFSVHLFDNLTKLSLLFSLSRNDDVAKGARTPEWGILRLIVVVARLCACISLVSN